MKTDGAPRHTNPVTQNLPRLMVISSLHLMAADTAALVARFGSLAASGVRMFQIREKSLGTDALTALCTSVLSEVAQHQSATHIVINNDPRAARLAGARGVHLPEHSHTVSACRLELGGPALVGCSVHSAERAREAESEGADYVIFSPIFRPSTKPNLPGVGLDALRHVSEVIHIPIFALGGVTPSRVMPCIDAGAYGVAVLAGLMAPKIDVVSTTHAYLHALANAAQEPQPKYASSFKSSEFEH